MGTQFGDPCPRNADLRRTIASVLGVHARPAAPQVHLGRAWVRDGVAGRELSWSVDDGPDTRAWFLRPSDADGDLPGMLLMHAHDGVKFYGKDKVADGPSGAAPGVDDLRARGYDGRCVATDLVRGGFAVLVHDVFPWGSRGPDWIDLPRRARNAGLIAVPSITESEAERRRRYDAAAREHEHGLAKVSALAGTSLAGAAVREDLIALAVLRDQPGIDTGRVGTLGFSGGGARVVHLLACHEPGELHAAAVTASMSTYSDIADGHADDTSWLMITPGLPTVCDWPAVASSAIPTPLLVQFAEGDSHFGMSGMRDAEAALQLAYADSGTLSTSWFADSHRFGAAMQDEAIGWLADRLVR